MIKAADATATAARNLEAFRYICESLRDMSTSSDNILVIITRANLKFSGDVFFSNLKGQ